MPLLARTKSLCKRGLHWTLKTIEPWRLKKTYTIPFAGRSLHIQSTSLCQLELMQKHIFTAAYYQQQQLYFAAMGFQPGHTMIDVGANIGYTAIVNAVLFPSSSILALEPATLNFKYLLHNAKNCPNIQPFNLGAHDQDSEAYLSMPSPAQNPKVATAQHYRNSGLLSMYGKSRRGAEKIVLKTLDHFVQSLSHIQKIGFIKIDVEGNEFNVLKGATMILKKDAPAIEVEINPKTLTMSTATYKDVRAFLSPFGYKPYSFSQNQLTPFSQDEVTETTNMVFIKK